MNKITKDERIDELLYRATIWDYDPVRNSFQKEKEVIENIQVLLDNGANPNNLSYWDEDMDEVETLLSYVIMKTFCHDRNFSFYSQVAELFINAGADITNIVESKYTALDHLILNGGTNGINQDTYRLAKLMITSLSNDKMKFYLLHHRKEETFIGLQNILKAFNKYDVHIEYMF